MQNHKKDTKYTRDKKQNIHHNKINSKGSSAISSMETHDAIKKSEKTVSSELPANKIERSRNSEIDSKTKNKQT
jgi:hypothetical protein